LRSGWKSRHRGSPRRKPDRQRAWENEAFTPTPPWPYVIDQFGGVDQADLITFPADNGRMVETGLYALTIVGRQDTGHQALRRYADAVRVQFAAGTVLSTGRMDARGPRSGQLVRIDGGWAYVQVSVPWSARSRNTILV